MALHLPADELAQLVEDVQLHHGEHRRHLIGIHRAVEHSSEPLANDRCEIVGKHSKT